MHIIKKIIKLQNIIIYSNTIFNYLKFVQDVQVFNGSRSPNSIIWCHVSILIGANRGGRLGWDLVPSNFDQVPSDSKYSN